MPNWCCNKIRIDFAEEEYLQKFVSSFQSLLYRRKYKTDEIIYDINGTDFYYKNKEKDIEIHLSEIEYEINTEELYFEIIYCKTRWNFHGEKLDAFFEYLSQFYFEECEIKYAEKGNSFFGSTLIVPDFSREKGTIEILDILLKNNDSNLINNILKFLPKYIIVEHEEIENIQDKIGNYFLEYMSKEELEEVCQQLELDYNENMTEEELIELLDCAGFNEYEYQEAKIEEWFDKEGYEEYHGLWSSSG